MLSVERLSYQVDQATLLAYVDLLAEPGEFLGVIGPNGAGKTTLLRAISGLLAAGGKVTVDGRNLAAYQRRELARTIAHVQQNTTIDFGFTCLEVVLMGRNPHLGRFQIEGAADHAIAHTAMKRTGTNQLAGRQIPTLSGGERQRVVLARALAQQPRLLVLDEPTASLDLHHQLLVLDLVLDLVTGGMAAVAALHDLNLAARYCDRLLLLKQGQVVASGSPAEVLTPDNLASAYGVNTAVRNDPLTGHLTVTVLRQAETSGKLIKDQNAYRLNSQKNFIMPITIAGVGPGDPELVTVKVQHLLRQADCIAGFTTVLQLAEAQVDLSGKDLIALDYRNQEAGLERLAEQAAAGKRCVLVMWGDPSVSGRELITRVEQASRQQDLPQPQIYAGIGAVQVAAARAGIAVEDSLVITFHRRHSSAEAVAALVAALNTMQRKIIVLPRPHDLMPPDLARVLLKKGIAAGRNVTIYQRLSLPDESAMTVALGELAAGTQTFSDLSIMVFIREEEKNWLEG